MQVMFPTSSPTWGTSDCFYRIRTPTHVLEYTRLSASSRETTRQVVCSLQLSDQISKFGLLQSLVSSLRTETLSRAQRGKFFKYSCFSFVLNCFLSIHGRAQRRKFLTPFCLLKYVLLYFHVFLNQSGRAQRGKNSKRCSSQSLVYNKKVRFSKF